MSAAKIAASLRSTVWTGTFGSSPSDYRRATGAARDLLGAHCYRPVARNLIVRFPAARLARQPGQEGQLRVVLEPFTRGRGRSMGSTDRRMASPGWTAGLRRGSA